MDEIKKLELENKILRIQVNEIYEFALETRNENLNLVEENRKLLKIKKIRLLFIVRSTIKKLKTLIYG
jgi:hypothetical protein